MAGRVPSSAMVQSARIGLVAALLVLAADVVVLATGAASDDDAASATSTTTSTVAVGAPTLPGETTLPTDTTAGPGESTTAPPVTDAQTTTTAAGPGAPASPDEPVARTMPAPGRYTLNVTDNRSGAVSQASFAVQQLNATDQRQTSQTPEGTTVQDMRYTGSGVELLYLDLAGVKQFQPTPPVLFAPVPPSIGDSWEWQMVSTDGRTTVEHQSTVTTFERITVAGRSIPTFVVETTLDLSGGGVNGTVTVTTWASTDYTMAVRTHQVVSILLASSDTTAELVSLDPT